MIYFITKRTDHDSFIYRSQKITVIQDYSKLATFFSENKAIGFDTEFSSLVYFLGNMLLMQFGNAVDQFVLDCTREQIKDHIPFLNKQLTKEHTLIGHNLKAEHNISYPYGLNFSVPKIWDTMIAEQRITLGTGLPVNLPAVYERRLKKFMQEEKETRRDFINMSTEHGRFLVKHIMYSAGDVDEIINIAKKQRQILLDNNQYNFMSYVENPLVEVLGLCELEGIYMNESKWKNILLNKKKDKFHLELNMDEQIRLLGKGNELVTGGKFTNKRKRAVVIQEDLFGHPSKEIENKNLHNVNYSSPQMVLDLIDRLGESKPTFQQGFGKDASDSVREEAVQAYLMEHPNTVLKPFLTSLLTYKELQKFISSYGDKFLYSYVNKGNGKSERGFKNPVTGNVHTSFKQCFTDTGRLSSGQKDEGTFNVQNLPALKEIRSCFTLSPKELADNWYISTIDLGGAELVIMAALANDQHLYQLGAINDDIHSPVATKCWRAVYQYRKAKLIEEFGSPAIANLLTNDPVKWAALKKATFTIKDSNNNEYLLTSDFLIDRQTNKSLRTDFKPMIFGCVYGLKAKKGSETLNIPKEEAQVMINVIKAEFPSTFKMVEEAARFALLNGYVIFNKRSNNRRNFPEVQAILSKIDRSKYSDAVILNYVKDNLPYKVRSDIEGAARNCLIQGTQADMIKEAMVAIHKYIKLTNTPAKLILSVHDELAYKHKELTKFETTKAIPLSPFGEKVKAIMIETANKYLSLYSDNIRMGASGETLKHWTK